MLRCNIPVIVMGETGCGKTRLIKFMCDLWKPPGAEVTNMILMKVWLKKLFICLNKQVHCQVTDYFILIVLSEHFGQLLCIFD